MKDYFDFFATLYDESAPVTNLGRGTHHSIFRSTTWFNYDLTKLDEAAYHDFSIIWDEDHDERILQPIESLYRKNLLAPVLFAGERKGGFSLILDSRFPKKKIESYEKQVQEVTDSVHGDHWPSNVSLMDFSDFVIIQNEPERAELYLRNIISLWSLGVKEIPSVRTEMAEFTDF